MRESIGKEYVITAIAVLAVLGIGFGLLINFGVTGVVYFGLALIVLAALTSIVYIFFKTRVKDTGRDLKVRILVKIRNDYRKSSQLVEKAGELADMSQIEDMLKDLHSKLSSLKCFNDRIDILEKGADKYTLTFIERVNRKAEEKLRGVEKSSIEIYRPKLMAYIEGLRGKLSSLKEAGYEINREVEAFEELSMREAKNLEAMIAKKEAAHDKFVDILHACEARASRLVATAKQYGSTESIEKLISRYRDSKDILEATGFLVKAREELKDILKGDFRARRAKLLSSMDSIIEILDDEEIPNEIKKEFADMHSRVLPMKDPGELKELNEVCGSYKDAIVKVVSTLNNTVTELEDKIYKHPLLKDKPPKIWSKDKEIPSLIKEVDKKLRLEELTKKVSKALTHIIAQLHKDRDFIKVMESYDKIEPVIDKKLQEEKSIKAEELKVKYPEKFLMIYNIKHQDTSYQEKNAVLERT